MPIDFPTTSTVGTKFTAGSKKFRLGAVGRWDADDYAALAQNRLINGAMTVSQQWGEGTVTGWVANGSGFPADQWLAAWNFGNATVTSHSYSCDPNDPGLSPWPGKACVIYSSAANPLLSGYYAHIYQPIEGMRMADALWGTANAKPVVLRFSAMCGQPGTYTFTIQTWDSTRSYYQSFTIDAVDVWQEYVFVIPGCTDGVWPIDNSAWGFVAFNAAFRDPYIGGSAGVWNTGGYYTDHAFNAWQTTGAYFRIANVGLYVDPFGTGMAPLWVHPQHAEETLKCMRYFYRAYSMKGVSGAPTSFGRARTKHPVTMRVAPSVTPVGTLYTHNGASGGTMTSIGSYPNTEYLEVDVYTTAFAGHYAGMCGMIYINGLENYLAVSARM